MKYDTCNRCPLNKKCEAEIKRQENEKQHSNKGEQK